MRTQPLWMTVLVHLASASSAAAQATTTPSPIGEAKSFLLEGWFSDHDQPVSAWLEKHKGIKDATLARLRAAIYEAAGEFQEARQQRELATRLVGREDRAAASPPPVTVRAGQEAYVGATSVSLRTGLEASAPVRSRLTINTRVEVVELAGDRARVRTLGPQGTRAAHLDPFAIGDSMAAPAPTAVTGYVAAGYLVAKPLIARDLVTQATALTAAGKAREAVPLLERAVALEPTNRTTLQSLVSAGLDSGEFTSALYAASLLAQLTAPIDGLDVEAIELYYGCRGELSRAAIWTPLPADLKAGRVPIDGCAANVAFAAPCDCEDREDLPVKTAGERARLRRAQAEYTQRMTQLRALIAPKPVLRLRVRNTRATATTGEPVRLAWLAIASGCGENGDVGDGYLQKTVPLTLPAMSPGETADVWLRVPAYENAEYVLLEHGDVAVTKALLVRIKGDAEVGFKNDRSIPHRSARMFVESCCCD